MVHSLNHTSYIDDFPVQYLVATPIRVQERNVHLKHFLWIVKAMERHTHALGLAHVQLAGTREQEATGKC